MTLTIGRRADRKPLTEATPGPVVSSWRMANVTHPDGAQRFAPMAIVFVWPEPTPESDGRLF